MDQSAIWILSLSGAALGLLGGVLGTWVCIMNTRGRRERAFAAWASAAMWLAILGFLAAMWFTPVPYRFLMWLPYAVALPLAIRFGNRRLEAIRREEATAHS